MPTTSLLLLIACLLIAAKASEWLCQRLSIPGVLGQLLVGVLVGPSLLGWARPDLTLSSFATMGVIMLMFIAGLETDLIFLQRTTRDEIDTISTTPSQVAGRRSIAK